MTIQEFEPHMAQGPAKKNAKNDEGNQLREKETNVNTLQINMPNQHVHPDNPNSTGNQRISDR